jgi:predicted DNA-binding transcriptional regulator AlpA
VARKAAPKLLIQRGTELYEAELVSQAEVMELLSITRQAVHDYMKRKKNPFPQPVLRHAKLLLWDRRDVAEWAAAHFRRRGDREAAKAAKAITPLHETSGILERAAAAQDEEWIRDLERIAAGGAL